MVNDNAEKLKELRFKNFKQYPNTIIALKKIRDNYLIIPKNRFGVIFVDIHLKKVKNLKISKNIIIKDVYIRNDETAIILNCLEINGYLVKINIHDFSYEIIEFTEDDHDVWLSRIYFWENDFIILVHNLGYFIKVDLNNKCYEWIDKKSVKNLDTIFTGFLMI